MSKKGSWAWLEYARANDDIRNKLVEEAWFDRKVEDQSFQQNVMRQHEANQGPGQPDVHGNVQGDRQGWNAHYNNPNGETTRSAAEEFYGRDHMGHSPEEQQAWGDRKSQADAFYGRGPEQVDHATLYGEAQQEPEQEL